MKTTRLLSIFVMLLGTLFFEGCLEIDVQTKISPDGSCERIIIVRNDSKSLPNSAFPIPLDPSWTTEWKKSEKDSSKYEYIARKHFNTPEDLSREYSSRPDTSVLKINVDIEKRFEWFYTYIQYKETYDIDYPFRKIPITSVLTADEIQSFVHGVENDSLKKRVDKWFIRNIFEDLFDSTIQSIKKKNDPSLPASKLIDKKELIYNITMNDSGPHNADDLVRLLNNVLNTTVVNSIRDELDIIWKAIDAKTDRLSKADASYTNYTEMPGLILDTNSDKIEGSRVTWKFSSDQLKIGKYEMNAKSRVTNVWAFIVTVIFGIFVLIVIVVLFRRR
jgi:hypothetical protein